MSRVQLSIGVVIGMHRATECIKTSMRLAFTFVLRAVDKVFLE